MSSATLNWDGQSFTASDEGFRWQTTQGQVHEGPWTELASVMAMRVTAKVHGVNVARWQHLGLALQSGPSFRVYTRDKAAFDLAEVVLANAARPITQRVLAELDAGKTLSFGAVTLSPQELEVKGKRWPLAQVAGHRTVHGYWMLDVGDKAAPKLAASVMLKDVPNHFALRAALDQLLPGAEYPEAGPDLGAVMRPSASSHDPRYLSGRGRLLLLGGSVAAAALVAGGIFGGFELSRLQQKKREAEARAKTLATIAKVAGVARQAQLPDAPFACAVLPASTDDAVVVAEVPAGVALPRPGDTWVYDERGVREVYPSEGSSHLLFAKVTTFAAVGDGYELDAAVALADVAAAKVTCSGRLRVRVPGKEYPDGLLADALAAALCPEGGTKGGCSGARKVARLPPPQAEPGPGELPVAEAAAPAPPTFKKGMAVEVQKKGKWVAATLVKPAGKAWRVRYAGKKKVEETVPLARLRAR
jgi:hypothetical protein